LVKQKTGTSISTDAGSSADAWSERSNAGATVSENKSQVKTIKPLTVAELDAARAERMRKSGSAAHGEKYFKAVDRLVSPADVLLDGFHSVFIRRQLGDMAGLAAFSHGFI
jgi:hypothetical protein